MQPKSEGPTFGSLVAILCVILLIPGDALAYMQQSLAATPTSSGQTAAAASAKIPPDQLESLVAPIALYPDPLLAQVLAASTYPLELIQLRSGWRRTKR